VRLRFPDVALGRPHYESVFCTLTHPSEAEALWIRTTVRKRPGQAPTGALWVTWFGESGVRAGKLDDLPVAPGGLGISCGPATQGPPGSRGALDVDGFAARWQVTFAPRAAPLQHLHPSVLYRAPLPRTKATSPIPDLDAAGTLVVDGRPVDLTGWTGVLGHNWGTEHAARWVYLHASGLGTDHRGSLDAILGRIRVRRLLAPWTGFGVLDLDGERHRLGGLLNRGSGLDLRPGAAVVRLTGNDLKVETRARLTPATTVGWEYTDPAGGRHEVVNSSVATMTLTLTRGDHHNTLTPTHRGVIEIGGDHRAVPVTLQPYPD
jgi:hypothetical protein